MLLVYQLPLVSDPPAKAREKIAKFIGGKREEIIFTSGATAGINLVARAWGDTYIKEGDEICLSVAEHHANLLPWQQLAKRKKAQLKFIPINKETKELDINIAVSLLSPKTRILALACTSNVLGALLQQQQLQQLLQQAKLINPNIITLVDAAQALPHIPLHAPSLGADFLVGSSHKMFGGTGIGFLWGRKLLLQRMQPDNYGGEMIQHVSFDRSTFTDPPWRFEAGTLPIAQIIGFAAAVDFLNQVGMNNIAAADQKLAKTLMEAVEDFPRVRILSVTPWGQQQQQQQQQQQPQQKGAARAAAAATTAAAAKKMVPICSFIIEGLSPFDLALCVDQWYHVHLRADFIPLC
ncbi:selenocysteine lyase, putative [Eimeria maxima]|uniref:Selenocysteine lyase, putative n=1 Tax=Eimeria maxima TaxID=5804 RepID=U6LX45_EIMMA|nr:selenocysteine lyase, putative [Eimeria maxima]CDJ56306.1 selenocysteine lyase, putative [Eimeria maxima]